MEEKEQPEDLELNGNVYTHVRTRVYTPVSVYKNDDSYVRIGPPELILPELTLHKRLLQFGFPIPALLMEGELDGLKYYIETSLGDWLLGRIFIEDILTSGAVSNAHFDRCLALTLEFVEAQLKMPTARNQFEDFVEGTHIEVARSELPKLSLLIDDVLFKLQKNLEKIPFVLSHGDLNPFNMVEGGVIDFGSSFNAPIGYDAYVNLYHTYNFPADTTHPNSRKYDFTKEQKNRYLEAIAHVYERQGMDYIPLHIDDFIMARNFWSTVKMGHYPELQKWRYMQFERLSNIYLSGGNLADSIVLR